MQAPSPVSHIQSLVLLLVFTFVVADRSALLAQYADVRGASIRQDDGWRRTADGWQQFRSTQKVAQRFKTSQHLSTAQVWPAAWAACMLLSIVGLSRLSQPRPGRKAESSIRAETPVIRSANTAAVPHDK